MVKVEPALENKTRKMIYNHIEMYPGVSFNILRHVFELTDGALRYHLDYLEKNQKINFELEKGSRCYYPFHNGIKVPRTSTDLLEFQKLSSQQQLILSTIQHNPGINQKDLVSRTRLNRFQVSRNLHDLEGLNLVKKSQYHRDVCYEYIPDDELKFKMIKRLVIKLLRDEIDEETFLKLKKRLD